LTRRNKCRASGSGRSAGKLCDVDEVTLLAEMSVLLFVLAMVALVVVVVLVYS